MIQYNCFCDSTYFTNETDYYHNDIDMCYTVFCDENVFYLMFVYVLSSFLIL